ARGPRRPEMAVTATTLCSRIEHEGKSGRGALTECGGEFPRIPILTRVDCACSSEKFGAVARAPRCLTLSGIVQFETGSCSSRLTGPRSRAPGPPRDAEPTARARASFRRDIVTRCFLSRIPGFRTLLAAVLLVSRPLPSLHAQETSTARQIAELE